MKASSDMWHPGDVILTSVPFVHVLLHKERENRCDSCFSRARRLLKCSACKLVKYCSKDCQRKAWCFHREECKGFKKVAPNVPKESVLLFYRLLVRLMNDDGKHVYEEVFGIRRKFIDLMSHIDELKADVERCNDFSKLCATLQVFAGDFNLPPGSELLEIFGKMVINSFSICDAEMQIIGAGIYLGPSVLDHSCRPNAVAVFSGTSLHIRCVRSFPVSDKVTISYIEQLDSVEDRQRQLMSGYYFQCQCEACLDTSVILQMKSFRCRTARCSGVVLQKEDTFASCSACGSESSSEKYFLASTQCVDTLEQAKQLKADGCADELYTSCKQCLDKHNEVLQPYNIFVVKLLDRLFDACIDLAKWTEAVEYGMQLTELYRRYLPDYHPTTGVHLMKLGKILLFLDRIDEAKALLVSASDIIVVTHGRVHCLYDNLCELLDQCHMSTTTSPSGTTASRPMLLDGSA